MGSTLTSCAAIAIAALALGAAPLKNNQAGNVDPVADVAQATRLAQDNNTFAFELYARLRDREGNLFFSPASVSAALAMTYAGASGNTAEEMARVMHFALGKEKLHPAFAALLRELAGAGIDPKKRGYQLSVANALWVRPGHPWNANFLNTTRTDYGAGLHEVDFGSTEQARHTINAWVEAQTHDKIKDLIPGGVLDSTTRLVLTNAIYFKGDWAAQFDAKATRDGRFFLTAANTVNVAMMHRHGKYRMFEDEQLQMLELPYQGQDLSMLILLPKKANGLGDLEMHLSAKLFDDHVKKLRDYPEIAVALPKFKINLDVPLTDVLREMGIKDAFNAGKADFSGMDNTKDLYIAAVLHKAYIEVNEQGTEAAAATGIVMKLAASPATSFRADHPFVFAIRDNRSGSVLFMGRTADPSAK